MKTNKTVSISYLTVTAMMGALSFVLQLLEFPIPFLIPEFIKFDFSDLPALISSFSLGPVSGVLVCLIKNVLHLTVSTTGGVGELANFLLSACFAGVAGLVYKYRKTKSGALLGSLLGALFMGLASVPLNLYLTYPFYYNFIPQEAILAAYQAIIPSVDHIVTCLWVFNFPFNLLKSLVITLITFLIYKHISPLLKGKKGK